MTTITALRVEDIRFPTSLGLDGSDAMNPDPDYSAAYVITETDRADLSGHGLTFTIGRGNEICCAAIRALEHQIVGERLEDIAADMGAFWRRFTSDSQLRWIGPDKGAIHGDRRGGQRGVGSVGQIGRQAGVAAGGGDDAGGAGALHRLPLHHRLHHAAGGAGAAETAGRGQERRTGDCCRKGTLLHHFRRLAGLPG